ncbi:MATE family efflux transporter [Sorangium sp. So ce1153]|uniref:MATE family efflux transporter n=1 Tax=Sorangium sp. So ce1153 TaxID=3133333 RepID=UPI003F634555
MNTKSGTDLTVGSIPRHIVTFSLPMLIGSIFQIAHSFINAIWVGQYLGTGALAVVTVSLPVIFTIFGLGMGMTLATNILVSQSFGAKRFDDLRRVVDGSTVLIYSIGIVLTILGEIFTPSILRAMDTPADILPESVDYLRISFLSLPFNFGMYATRSMLQGMGDSKTPLYFQFGSIVLTTVLDPLLIFGKLGLPELGVNGTAWATLVSHLLALIVLHAYLRAHSSPVAARWPRLDHIGPSIRQMVRIGVPASIQQSLVSLGMVMVTGVVNGFGETATATFGAVSRIEQIALLPAITFGVAISTLAGQNLGAGHHSRVREVFAWGSAFSGTMTVVISAVTMIFPDGLLKVLTRDPAVLELGVAYLQIVAPCYVFYAVAFVCNGIINGAGATVVTTANSLITLWVIRVPVAYWLSRVMNSVTGVWYAIALSFIVSMVVGLGYYFSGHWKKAFEKKGEPKPRSDPAEGFASDVGEA